MADGIVTPIDFDVTPAERSLAQLERRLQGMFKQIQGSGNKVPILSQEARTEFANPQITTNRSNGRPVKQTSVDVQRFADLSAKMASYESVLSAIGNKRTVGTPGGAKNKDIVARIREEAVANLSSQFKGGIIPDDLLDTFNTRFTESINSSFKNFRGVAPADLANHYKTMSQNLFGDLGVGPVTVDSPRKAIQSSTESLNVIASQAEARAAALNKEEAAARKATSDANKAAATASENGRISRGGMQFNTGGPVVAYKKQGEYRKELQTKAMQYYQKITGEAFASAENVFGDYQNDVSKLRTTGQKKTVDERTAKAALGAQTMGDEAMREALAQAEALNIYFGNLQKVLALEKLVIEKSYNGLRMRESTVAIQENVALLQAQVESEDFKTLKRQQALLRQRLGQETSLPVDERANNRLDKAGARRDELVYLSENAEEQARAVRTALEAENAQKRLNLATNDARLEDKDSQELDRLEAMQRLRGGIILDGNRAAAKSTALSDSDMQSQIVANNLSGIENNLAEKNATEKAALENEAIFLARGEEEILKLQKEAQSLERQADAAGARALRQRIAVLRQQLKEVSELPPEMKADIFAGQEAREAAKYRAIQDNPAIRDRLINARVESELIKQDLKLAAQEATVNSEEYANNLQREVALRARQAVIAAEQRTIAAQNLLDDPLMRDRQFTANTNSSLATRKVDALQKLNTLSSAEFLEVQKLESEAALRMKILAKQAELGDDKRRAMMLELRTLEIQEQQLEAQIQQQAMMATGNGGRGGRVANFFNRNGGGGGRGGNGNFNQFATDPGGFFLGGTLSTLKYGVGAGIMYGAFGLLSEAVKDSEEFNVSLTRLEAQLEGVDSSGQTFKRMRDDLVDLSKETGIAANDLTNMATRIQGAFGSTNAAEGNGLRGNDGIVRYGQSAVDRQIESAAKLAKVTGLTEKEISDELTAASIAFGASGDYIGDVIVKLEQTTSVGSSELLNFLGDIGPAAKNAGFELEEFAAIGATILKQSSIGGAALAEQTGRILAAMSQDPTKFMDFASRNRGEFRDDDYTKFISSLQEGQTNEIFKILARNYRSFNKTARDDLVNQLGGQREANTLLAAFNDPEGLTRAERDANDAYGSLDKKNEKLQQKISYILSQLDTTFNDLVKSFLDAGIIDAVSQMAQTLGVVLNVVSEIAGVFNTVDEMTGGVLSFVTAIAIQMGIVLATAAALAAMRGPAGGAEDVAAGALNNAQMGGLGGRRQNIMANRFTGRQQFQLARDTRLAAGARGGRLGASAVGVASGVKASVGNLGALLGTAGTGFIVGSAAVATYGFIKGKIDQDRAAVAEIMNQAIASDKSAKELREEASRQGRKDRGFFQELSQDVFGNPTEEDALNAAAAVKDTEKFREQMDKISVDQMDYVNGVISGMDEARTEMVKNTLKDSDKVFAETGTALNAEFYELLRGAGMLDDFGKRLDFAGNQLPDFKDTSAEDLVREYATNKSTGKIDADKVGNDFIEQVLKNNDIEGIAEVIDIINNNDNLWAGLQAQLSEFQEEENTEGVDTVSKIMQALQKKAGDEIYKKYIASSQAVNEFLTADIEFLGMALDQMIARREAGLISIETFRETLEKKLEEYKRMAQTADTMKAVDAIEAALEGVSTYMRESIDLLAEIDAIVFDDVDRADTNTIESNLSLLRDKKFTNAEERRAAAISVYQAMRDQTDRLIEEAETVEEIQKIIDDGVTIPMVAVAEEALGRVKANQDYQSLAIKYQALRTPKNVKSPELQGILDRSGLDQNVGPRELLESVFAEIAETGKISKTTIDKFILTWQVLNEGMQHTGISEEEKKTIAGGMAFIENMFGSVGKIAAASPAKKTPFTLSMPSPLKAIAGLDFVAENKNPFGIDLKKILDVNGDEARKKLIELNKEIKETAEDLASARLEIAKAMAEDNGDLIEVARIGVQQAEAALAFAKSNGTPGEILRAQAGIIAARKGLRDAINEVRDAEVSYLKAVTSKDNPLAAAEFDLNFARILQNEARGTKAKAEAALAVLEAERALASEIADARLAQMDLRRAQLEAMDDEVGAAYIDAQQAQQELADGIARGAGPAEIMRLQAGVVSADRGVRDTLFQNKLDEYDYLLNTGKITQKQYVDYLEGLKSTLDPASKQFKDLEVQLYQLKQGLGQDLQMNLPTNLTLPTLYEARRLNQVGGASGAASGQSVGYQDNRNMDIQIVIGQNMSESEIVTILSDALGVGRNALTTPKRY